MENITIGQIVGAIGILGVLGGFFTGIFKWYKTNISDKFVDVNEKIDKVNTRVDHVETYVKAKNDEFITQLGYSNKERKILLKGELAALKGLSLITNDDLINESINEIEDYMLNKTHDAYTDKTHDV